MFVSTKTTIGFKLPDEQDLLVAFMKTNDLSDWKQDADTLGVYFTKTQCYFTESKGVDNYVDENRL